MTPEIIDQANELTEHRTQLAINALRINHDAVSATHCAECGDPIPEARRKAYPGCTMCVSCQTDADLRNKHKWGM